MKSVSLKIIAAIFLLPAYSLALPVLGDGCLPGEPCYTEPKKAMDANTPKAVMADPSTIDDSVPCGFYMTIGGGWKFLEKDEPILGHQIYEIKAGLYRYIHEDVSLEATVGYMPDVRNREFPDPDRFFLSDNTTGMEYGIDALYHLSEEDSSGFDPYLAFGGGLQHYNDALEDGHTQVFIGTGVGAFVNLTDSFFFKPDYRVRMVDSDTEVNHKATLSFGMFF